MALTQLTCQDGQPMFDEGKFDIFREFADGNILWLTTVLARADAKTRMIFMALQVPGTYFVWHHNRQIAHIDTTTFSKTN